MGPHRFFLGRELTKASGWTTYASPFFPESRQVLASQRNDAKCRQQKSELTSSERRRGCAGVRCCPHAVNQANIRCRGDHSFSGPQPCLILCGAEAMRFSWIGLILAPLLVPLMFCAVMLSFLQTNGSVPLL